MTIGYKEHDPVLCNGIICLFHKNILLDILLKAVLSPVLHVIIIIMNELTEVDSMQSW